MLFNSFKFLILFLPPVLVVSRRLRGQMLLFWICLSSFVFYAFAGHFWFLGPMLFTTALDFFLAQKIGATEGWKKKTFFLVSLCGNLGLLFYFKYSGFFLRTFFHIGNADSETWQRFNLVMRILLPAGISFYTFQTLSYIIDVYRGEVIPERNFWLFCAFVSFFPHLVAGPLTRHDQLIPQLERIAQGGTSPRWRAGVYLFAIGLAKKTLLADPIARIIDPMIAAPGAMSPLGAWLSVFGYSLQIYFDFSGYSDMAIGLGRFFGIELPQNFNTPYVATDPSDFWQRWHITLTHWLRDYLFYPLVMMRGKSRGSTTRVVLSLVITMFLAGLWHGANWMCVLFGLYHGALLLLYHGFKDAWNTLHHLIRRSLNFFLVTMGFLLFRSGSLQVARRWAGKLAGHAVQPGIPLGFDPPILRLLGFVLIGLGIACLPFCASKYDRFERLGPAWQVVFGLVTVFSLLFMNYSSRFIYYQF